MCGVGIKHLPANHIAPNGLQHDFVEYFLVNLALIEPAAAVLTEGGGVWNFVLQGEPQKPPISDIDLSFFNETPFATDTKQVPEKEHLEQNYRINRWSSVV